MSATTDQRTVGVTLDNALGTLQRTALGEGHDVTPAEAQAVLAELERLQAIERRAVNARQGNAELHDDEEQGWLSAAHYILAGEDT